MKTLSRFVSVFSVSALCVLCGRSATPLPNARLTGTAEVPTGATLDVNGSLDLTGATVIGLSSLTARQTNFNALTASANTLPYFTGSDTFGTVNFSSLSQTLLPLSTSADWRDALFPASPVAGDMVYFNGTTWTKQSLGTINGIPRITTGGIFSQAASGAGGHIVVPGPLTSSGLTSGSGKLAGRATAGGGAMEEIDVGAGLKLDPDTSTLASTSLFSGRAARTGTYTVVAADRGLLLDCANSFTLSLTEAATLGDGFLVGVYNSGSGTITIDAAGSEAIRDPAGSATTKTLIQGEGIVLVCDGAGWIVPIAAKASTSATGDVTSNTSSSVDGEVALFSSTGGKTIKRATGTGLAKLTAGVLGTATAGTDYLPVPGSPVEGDLYYYTSGNWTRLARGTSGQVLKAGASTLEWGTDSTGSGSLPASPVTGDMIYFNGTDWVRRAVGTTGQVLKVSSGLPAWADAGGGTVEGPPPSFAFTYSSAGDSNGVFYWFGTNFGANSWSDPNTAGRLPILLGNSGTMTTASLVDRTTASNNYIDGTTDRWIVFDLGSSKQLACATYSLRNGGSTSYVPVNWVLEGTNSLSSWNASGVNGGTWTTIDTRTSNTDLAVSNSWASFTSNGDATTGYRYIRWRHTAAIDYLILNEIELYGTVTSPAAVSTIGAIASWGDTSGTVLLNSGAKVDLIGNITLTQAGAGLHIKEGTNARLGTATLTAGAATVSTTAVTATSRIFLTSQSDGGTPGFVRVSARTAGTSFTITSSSGTDTSTIAWLLVEPAP